MSDERKRTARGPNRIRLIGLGLSESMGCVLELIDPAREDWLPTRREEPRMDIALSYLRQLHLHSYFQKQHSTCDGVWFKNHPACRDAATWERVKQYLVEENFLNEVWLSPSALKEAHLHPKDELDAWWFELTPKEAQAVEQASPDAP